MDNLENTGGQKKTNWLAIAIGGLVVFGIATVIVAVITMKPAAEKGANSKDEDEEEFAEIEEDWFTEPEEISDSVSGDSGFSKFWSDYLNSDEIASVEKTIADYFAFAFPKFSEVKVEKMVRDGKELIDKKVSEEEEGEADDLEELDFDELFTDEEEESAEEEEDEPKKEEVRESTRVYLASDTGRKFYVDIDAGQFGLIGVSIYTEAGQEVFHYGGENDFDTFDYSDEEIIDEAFAEIE